MKRVFLTILASVVTSLSFCQSQKSFILSYQDKKGFFAVSAGGSLPLGRFASCSVTDSKAGMAGQGLAVNAAIGYRIVGPVGLMVRGEQHQNALQTHELIDAASRANSTVWTAKADNWSITTLMAGPYISIPMERFSLDARLLVGQAMTRLPETAMSAKFGDVNMLVKTTGSPNAAVALGGGVSLRYRLGRCLSLHLSGDYTHSQFTFDAVTSKSLSSYGTLQTSRFNCQRVMSVVSASAGLMVLFGNHYRPF
ncbi:hypothetical protein HNV11_20445 [Spirosoma taeanense]|uniref:Outer membrane protein beta-barrel domain-containing protein n=1 Tax=Spirosoma taeanense TaxID=2735870 RepID=A0A6M5YE34_9BACT|nr:hypothetical protein [Spirosoma taeanense]QJW91580.1 hypothetical protein HNV11_20445 [Spirosoma taeanense]